MTEIVGSLSAAAQYLSAARAELSLFAENHPDEMSPPVAQAQDMTAAAIENLEIVFAETDEKI